MQVKVFRQKHISDERFEQIKKDLKQLLVGRVRVRRYSARYAYGQIGINPVKRNGDKKLSPEDVAIIRDYMVKENLQIPQMHLLLSDVGTAAFWQGINYIYEVEQVWMLQASAATSKGGKTMQHPMNYRTQTGLLNALNRVSEGQSSVGLAWWLRNAEFALIKQWGWNEEAAALYISRCSPQVSVYKATGF